MLAIRNVIASLEAADARRVSKAQRQRPTRRFLALAQIMPKVDDVEYPRGGLAVRLASAAAAGIVVATTATGPAQAVGPVSIPFDDVTYQEIECAKGTMSSVGGSVQIKSGETRKGSAQGGYIRKEG